MEISDKQQEMLAFIENFVEENGYPPTYEEIRIGLDISSKSLVNYHLEVLENAALLKRRGLLILLAALVLFGAGRLRRSTFRARPA